MTNEPQRTSAARLVFFVLKSLLGIPRMELLKICNFDPKALESCENFNVSNVDYCKLVSLVRGFWFGEVKSVESVEVSPTLGLPYLYK